MNVEQDWNQHLKEQERATIEKLQLLVNPANLGRYLGYQIAPHHQAILSQITGHKRTLTLAPRGHGKSTVGTVIYCLWKVLVNPDVRILICSNTDRQAKSFMREIKAHLESEKITRLFGDLQGPKWSDEEITLANKSKITKESTITALGSSGQVITRHFDVLIADDIVDFENARTQGQREKLKEWFYTSLLPTLEPDGELHIYGTRYHPFDLYQSLIDSGEYEVQIMRALNEDNQALWPELFPAEYLQRIKQEVGSLIFNMQYQNDVELAKEGSIFKYEWLQFYQPYELPRDFKVYMGVDLAISQRETADYFAIAVVGIDEETNNIYVLDIYKDRLSFKQQQEAIKRKNERWQPVRIAIESNQYQAVLAQVLADAHLPIKQVHTTKDKVSRAQQCSALFENGQVYIRSDMSSLTDELVLFPDVEHDDQVDALMLALETLRGSQISPEDIAGLIIQSPKKIRENKQRNSMLRRKRRRIEEGYSYTTTISD